MTAFSLFSWELTLESVDSCFYYFNNNNDLIDCFLLFDQRIDYTYKKKDYKSRIDHIFIRSQEIKNIKYYEVIDEPNSLSDRNAVTCFIDLVEDTRDYNEEEESQIDFHYFDLKDQDFVEIYQNFLNKNLDLLIPKVNIDFYNNLSECTSLIDEIYENIPRILLKSAREAEKICKKLKKRRRVFKTNYNNNLEINSLSEEINQLYAAFKVNDFLVNCTSHNIGACVNGLNLSIIAYCDDIIILSLSYGKVMVILDESFKFANQWKMEFNPKKSVCLTMSSSKIISQEKFVINWVQLVYVDGFE
ncbi:unnamed protein product [Brachionus calyciflorus]|uniref:Uncharacterized protein n=1 Tax=Brachionus calyciflorus TaxID=104777 RepID=A0A814AG93_9BILA|nr:unnamed protein product [Brachionus calyciflorus]